MANKFIQYKLSPTIVKGRPATAEAYCPHCKTRLAYYYCSREYKDAIKTLNPDKYYPVADGYLEDYPPAITVCNTCHLPIDPNGVDEYKG